MYTKSEIAKKFDHTFLKAFGTKDTIDTLCQEAKDLSLIHIYHLQRFLYKSDYHSFPIYWYQLFQRSHLKFAQ